MAGYDGYSMSINAREAYRSGEKPMSKWTKKAILTAASDLVRSEDIPADVFEEMKEMKKDDLLSLLSFSSWHHTSKMYNATDFYALDVEKILHRFGYKEALFCDTPDGEKPGMWADRKESGTGFYHFNAADGTVYNKEDVSFSRFGFVKI